MQIEIRPLPKCFRQCHLYMIQSTFDTSFIPKYIFEVMTEIMSYMYCTIFLNPMSTRPHQNVVWYNNSWLGFLKNSELCTKRKRKIFWKKMSPHLLV